MSETALVQSKPALPSLYECEDDLLALLNSEGDVDPQQEAAFRADLAEQMRVVEHKRDAVAGFIKMCEYRAVEAGEEAKRLQARKRVFENAAARLRGYVVGIIQSLGPDAKWNLRKLEGRHFTLSARACPASVEITDEARIPIEYKNVTVTMQAQTWREICPEDADEMVVSYSVDRFAVKKAIEAGHNVPGADLAIGKYVLQVR